MPGRVYPEAIRLAVACETPPTLLSKLLERQRAEEPETPILLSEVSSAGLVLGLKEGRFDAGLTLTPFKEAPLQTKVLWRDDLVVALPMRSPLLGRARIPLDEIAEYPLVMLCCDCRKGINPPVEELLRDLKKPINIIQYVRSFELMIVLVAAGYGVAFGGRSRFDASSSWNIVTRPLAGPPRALTTHLIYNDELPSPRLYRFARRAAVVQGDDARQG
ncbi:LysR family substrate-binding domain-containing protein [Burkholderia multivorans]|uniref:LysR family substrate-binding domain-containing protein n=1 Tax=Burkholderia multivorans TaxID=87883 RepID=UPI001C98B677|nr:LysR family substrate-binding domain-containing protein [Burkholderia multivorans]MBY4674334.1 LysR family substrate-binding domain-containing protein [Burkholderia multivorans]